MVTVKIVSKSSGNPIKGKKVALHIDIAPYSRVGFVTPVNLSDDVSLPYMRNKNARFLILKQ